jgi:hypothetical protein
MPVGPGLAEPERTEELRARLDNREPTRGSYRGQRASGSAGRIHSSSRPRMPERRRNLLAGRETSIHPVLDLAAGAVEVLVEGAGVDLAGGRAARRRAGALPGAGARPGRPRGACGSSCPACARGSRRSGGRDRPWPNSPARPRPAQRRGRRPGAGCAPSRRRHRRRWPHRPSAPPGQSRNQRAAGS